MLEPLEPRYLLSADLMPFTVDMAVDGDDITLRFDEATERLQILDNRSGGAVVSERPGARTSEVRIAGSQGDDRLAVDFAVEFSLAGGITFDGGAGVDRLHIANGLFDTSGSIAAARLPSAWWTISTGSCSTSAGTAATGVTRTSATTMSCSCCRSRAMRSPTRRSCRKIRDTGPTRAPACRGF